MRPLAGQLQPLAGQLQPLAERVRPLVLAGEQTLPVIEALAPLFPGGALRRGITIGVQGTGATTLGFCLVAAATRQGGWAAFVGGSSVGWMAATEVGVALERVAVLLPGPAEWASTVAALIGAFDVVVLAGGALAGGGLAGGGLAVRAGDARRLMARARERGSVLIALHTEWPERPDLSLTAASGEWEGLGTGHGYLRERRLVLSTTGRRDLSRPQELTLAFGAASSTRVECRNSEHDSFSYPYARRLVP